MAFRDEGGRGPLRRHRLRRAQRRPRGHRGRRLPTASASSCRTRRPGAWRAWSTENPQGAHGVHEYALEDFGITTGAVRRAVPLLHRAFRRLIGPGRPVRRQRDHGAGSCLATSGTASKRSNATAPVVRKPPWSPPLTRTNDSDVIWPVAKSPSGERGGPDERDAEQGPGSHDAPTRRGLPLEDAGHRAHGPAPRRPAGVPTPRLGPELLASGNRPSTTTPTTSPRRSSPGS